MEKKASSIDIYRTLGVPNVIIGWAEDVHVIDTKRGKVQVATAPYPLRNRLLAQAEHRGKSIENWTRRCKTSSATTSARWRNNSIAKRLLS